MGKGSALTIDEDVDREKGEAPLIRDGDDPAFSQRGLERRIAQHFARHGYAGDPGLARRGELGPEHVCYELAILDVEEKSRHELAGHPLRTRRLAPFVHLDLKPSAEGGSCKCRNHHRPIATHFTRTSGSGIM
jgi:hypothetical protein